MIPRYFADSSSFVRLAVYHPIISSRLQNAAPVRHQKILVIFANPRRLAVVLVAGAADELRG